jgi:hypothetical protein
MKQVFVDVICLLPAGGNLSRIYVSLIFDYLSISVEGGNGRPGLSWKNHGCKFTPSWEMAVKTTRVCVRQSADKDKPNSISFSLK